MKYPDEMIGTIVQDYVSGQSTKNVAIKHGINITTVRKLVQKSGNHVRNSREARQVYKIDEMFFDKIDTYTKAQILGFIWADGCIHRRGTDSRRLQIVLKRDDLDYLEWIRREMKSERPLRIASYHGKDGRTRNIAAFCTSNAKLIDALEKLGVGPRKSLAIGFPDESIVPIEFMSAFILGVFEGDGCIHVPPSKSRKNRCADVSVAATINFNERLQTILAHHDIISTLRLPLNMKGKNFCVLRIGTVASVMNFYDFIYAHHTFKMERKHQRFIEFKSKYDDNLNFRFNLRISSVEGHVISPTGTMFYFNTITDFAKEMGLNVGGFHNFISRRNHYQTRDVQNGWRIPTPIEISAARSSGTLVEKIYRHPV